jgi:protein required for attachment to host cells
MSSYAWIVVADAARARIFSTDNAKLPLQPLEQLVSPKARLHERDLKSDRPGSTYDSHGDGRHATGTNTSPKQQEAVRFAKTISENLELGRVNHEFDRLVLVAEPQFLGLLRKAITPEVAKLVSDEIDKDLSKADRNDIRRHLPERL